MTKQARAPSPAVSPVTIAANVAQVLRGDGKCAYFAEGTLGGFASTFQPFMMVDGKGGSFDAYIAHARVWRIGYEIARQRLAEDVDSETVKLSDASQDAFERRIAAAKREGLLKGDKPRSASTAATKKAAQRAKASDVKGTPAQWRTQASELIGKGDVKGAQTALANAQTLERKAASDAKQKAADATKDAAEALRASITVLRAAGDAKALNALAAQAKKLAAGHLKAQAAKA